MEFTTFYLRLCSLWMNEAHFGLIILLRAFTLPPPLLPLLLLMMIMLLSMMAL